ncbi:SsrA-binding protein [Striga asiatica]|uniref:SsrA-binding protein n=1 Tax=Striga asiatica TaxID=4170 RepID=A0A5A7RIQ6_STRAF|nr:SsrA-binding protein [Striga asiatica]
MCLTPRPIWQPGGHWEMFGVFSVLESGDGVVSLDYGVVTFGDGGVALENGHVAFGEGGLFFREGEVAFLDGGVSFGHDRHYLFHRRLVLHQPLNQGKKKSKFLG